MTDAEVLAIETGEPLAPDAVAVLARETAVHTESNRGAIETIDDKLDEIRRGKTEWQQRTDERLDKAVAAIDGLEKKIRELDGTQRELVNEVRKVLLAFQSMATLRPCACLQADLK